MSIKSIYCDSYMCDEKPMIGSKYCKHHEVEKPKMSMCESCGKQMPGQTVRFCSTSCMSQTDKKERDAERYNLEFYQALMFAQKDGVIIESFEGNRYKFSNRVLMYQKDLHTWISINSRDISLQNLIEIKWRAIYEPRTFSAQVMLKDLRCSYDHETNETSFIIKGKCINELTSTFQKTKLYTQMKISIEEVLS